MAKHLSKQKEDRNRTGAETVRREPRHLSPKPEKRTRTRPEPERTEPELEAPALEVPGPETPKIMAPPRRRSRFGVWFTVYIFVLLALVTAGLAFLWSTMDVYERSRPQKEMDELLAATDSALWRKYLLGCGVSEKYLDTLDLSDVSYYKKVDAYTDEAPAYGVRFGTTDMLVVTLKAGQELRMGFHLWQIDSTNLAGSGLRIYAPENATVLVRGEPIGEDCLVKRNAQPLTLGELEANRQDIPGLSQYRADSIYDNEEVRVIDGAGNELSLSYESGKAYYYAPVTNTYIIEAPAEATVTVNGVALSEANAGVETEVMEEFQGIESYLSFDPKVVTYTVEGLVARPAVEAEGLTLSLTEEGNRFVFARESVDELSPEISRRVQAAFEAYIAFSGNKGGNLKTNLSNYSAFLVPGGEAADRANKAQDSLSWVTGRDTALQAMNIQGYTQYAEDCFTCAITFTVVTDETADKNGILFVFVPYRNEWRVVRVLNTTSYLS